MNFIKVGNEKFKDKVITGEPQIMFVKKEHGKVASHDSKD